MNYDYWCSNDETDILEEFDNLDELDLTHAWQYRQFPSGRSPLPQSIGGFQGFPFSKPPQAPPPSFIPSKAQVQAVTQSTPGTMAVEPGTIRPCTKQYIYLWLNDEREFWAYLTYIGRRSTAGWRWTGYNWVYFSVDLRKIETFICVA